MIFLQHNEMQVFVCNYLSDSGRHVVIVAQRTILPKTVNRSINSTGPRPRSRTLTHVQESILEVITYYAELKERYLIIIMIFCGLYGETMFSTEKFYYLRYYLGQLRKSGHLIGHSSTSVQLLPQGFIRACSHSILHDTLD